MHIGIYAYIAIECGNSLLQTGYMTLLCLIL